ncbi:MAG: GspMb/PilO family protein [Bryobacterales bacterium]|jgi:hypothetical protein|nr:GspMb/PilO family protein [Bryobacterales bacterium]
MSRPINGASASGGGLSSRDRRALALLLLVLLATTAWYFLAEDAALAPAPETALALPLPVMEKRLVTLRQQAALNPSKEGVREVLLQAVEEREQKLLRADTAQQVQAQLLAKVRGVMEAQDPPLRATQSELGAISRLGDEYGEVAVTVGFNCAIEQMVNLLADLSALEELIATRQINVAMADRAKKTLNVRLTVTGLMPVELAPEANGGFRP